MQSIEVSKRGVAIVLTRPDGKVAMITESNDSWETHKRSGDASIPMESTNPGESPGRVIERLNEEEINISPLEVVTKLSSIYVRPWVLVEVYYCRTIQDAELKQGTDIDIYGARWEDRIFALRFPVNEDGLRPGTREAFLDAITFEQSSHWVPTIHQSTIDKVPDQYYLERGFEIRQAARSGLQYLQSAPVLP